MNTPAAIASFDATIKEKEQFWKEHEKRQREGGLSRAAYCRKHQLSYDRFGYWQWKWRQQAAPSRLLPIHLNGETKITDCPRPETICTLSFKNGPELKIHDKAVLPMLLSLWS